MSERGDSKVGGSTYSEVLRRARDKLPADTLRGEVMVCRCGVQFKVQLSDQKKVGCQPRTKDKCGVKGRGAARQIKKSKTVTHTRSLSPFDPIPKL